MSTINKESRLKELMEELESGYSDMTPSELQSVAKELRKLAECQWKSYLRNDVAPLVRQDNSYQTPFSQMSIDASESGPSESSSNQRPMMPRETIMEISKIKKEEKAAARQQEVQRIRQHGKQYFDRIRQASPKVVSKLSQNTLSIRSEFVAERTMARAAALLEQTRKIQHYLGARS